MDDWIELSPDLLSIDAAVRFVSHADAGGIAVFLGTTRAEASAAGQSLLALDYEAYAEMAVAQMRALAGQARERWPILKFALLHRVGRVAVEEPSVIIAVATAHRAQAFEACRFLIDALKAQATIWKKEVWADGSTSWVQGHEVGPPG